MAKKAIAALCIILACVMLSSCSLGNAILASMGFDTYDYEGEEVEEVLPNDCDEVREVAGMIKILSVNNPTLPTFDSSGEAVESCRDSILNYMMCTGFAKYTGNTELIEEAQAEYPELRLITVIPAGDFEDFVYTYFGGNAKVTNKSGELFIYLDKAEAYTSVTVPIESEIAVNVIACEKTERTYRLKFTCSLGDVTSHVYRALIVNREDGSSYFKSLKIIDE